MTASLLDRIANAQVSAEMMETLVSAIAEYGAGSDSTLVAFSALSRSYVDIPAEVITSALFRMEALGHLIEAGLLKEWQLLSEAAAYSVVSSALLHAAAKATLLMESPADQSRPAFDPDEVRSLALASIQPEGRA